MRPCPRLPRDIVDVPSLKVLKTGLVEALGKLIYWVESLPMAGGLELNDSF